MAELKPCPFCGSTKLKIESKSTRAGWTGIDALVEQDTYSVRCNVCHARGGTAGGKVIKSLRYMYKDNMPEWATTSEAVKERAIEAWNKRTEPERPKGRWKYYHKRNIAVCTNCSFERKLDADFGKAITCPNCGADMRGGSE